MHAAVDLRSLSASWTPSSAMTICGRSKEALTSKMGACLAYKSKACQMLGPCFRHPRQVRSERLSPSEPDHRGKTEMLYYTKLHYTKTSEFNTSPSTTTSSSPPQTPSISSSPPSSAPHNAPQTPRPAPAAAPRPSPAQTSSSPAYSATPL